MRYEVIDKWYHPNGNAVPFVAAIIDDADEGDVKLVIMFEDEDYTAVFSLGKLQEDDISRTNSWPGSRYEFLRDVLWSDD